MQRALGILFVSVGLLASSVSFGWGEIGHRTTGQIAAIYLTPQAQQAVKQILQANGDLGGAMADAAVWADRVKQANGMHHTSTYHYENIPDNTTYLASLAALPPQGRANGGVVEGILVAEKMLLTPGLAADARQMALRFLVHFIGDLHQPLHTGRPDDRGGNDVKVTWFNTPSNLHSVWDTGIIVVGHRDIFGDQPPHSDVSALYAKYLTSQYKPAQLAPQTWGNVETWLAESINARTLCYDAGISRNQNAYLAKALPVVDQRVYSAGMRIADTLNRIFANQPMSAPDVTLMANITKIVGDLSQIITLGPRANDGPNFLAPGFAGRAPIYEGYQQ